MGLHESIRLLLCVACVVFAATQTPSVGYSVVALQAALSGYASGDTVVLTNGGTWTGCGSAVWKVPLGKQLTFVGQGTGTHFECAYYQDSFTGQASFINMIFDNGPGQTYGDKGGVATIISGQATFADCTFNANVVSGSAGGGHIKACTSSVNVTRCTLQGGGANVGGSIFAESVTSLIIADSVFINNVAATYGGAVYIDCSPFDVRNTAFTSNTGKYGGAFALDGSDQSSLVQLFSHNVRFINNRATSFGGAVWFCLGVQTSPVTMTDTLFLGNEITYDPTTSASPNYDSLMSYSASYEPDDIQPEGSGGALFTGLRIDMTRVNFTSNQAFLLGSGVYAYGSGGNPANMWTDVTFWRNAYLKPQKPHSSSEYTYWEVYRYYWYLRSIDAFGGGAFVSSYDITALRLKAANNIGTAGGAIYAYKSTFSCDGCQFTSNTATFTYGGALAMDTSTLILNNSLFEFNYCAAYGGGAIFMESGIGQSTMTSVTFRNNSVAPALSFGGGNEYDTHGGAILATTQHRKAGTGRLALVGCTFFANTAYSGGAMRFEYSANPTDYLDYVLTVDSCRFEANFITADGYYLGAGGGIDFRNYWSDADSYVLRAHIFNTSFVGNIGGRRPYNSGQAGTVIASYGAGSAIATYINTRLTIDGCTFTDNIVSAEGTIYSSSYYRYAASHLTINNSTFLRNTADRYGGGIAADYTLVNVTDTRIEDNVLSGLHPLANYHGAGMYLDCYTITHLVRVNFTHNTNAKGNGGAIAARGYYDQPTGLTVENCPFRNNAAQSGGAISMQTETYGYISNAVFDSNEASADGGAFYSSDWISFTCEFNNVNVTRNRAGSRGGGIFLSNGDLYYYSSSSSYFNVAHMNTVLVRGNTAQQGGGIFTEIGMSMEYVDLIDNSAVSGWGGGMFAGGYSNVFYTDASVRNNSAGVAGGGIYAIGEYSFSGSFAPATVDVGNVQLTHNSAASGGAMFIDKEASVSIAINSVFEFNAGLGAAIRGDSFSSLSIYDSVVRNHVGSQATISLSGGSAQLENVAIRDNAARSGGVVTLIDNNFCGTNVNLDNNTSPVSDGGALFAQNSYVLLDASFITRNKGIDGGAIYATSDSEVDITNTLLSGNVAQQTGGAISVATSTVCLTGCTVHDNVAASGGAIAVGTKASLELSWSTVSHNSASKEGGAVVFLADTTLSASDSVLSANTAGTGGAVSVNGLAVVTLSNLTMNDNLATAEGGSLSIANIRSLDMHNCWVANSRGSSGGSISFSSPQDARIVNTTFHASTATGAPGADRRGGAIFCRGTNVHRVSLVDTDIEVSTAGSGRGGAIAVQGCRLSVARGSISLCTAASGGGLDYEGDASLDGFVQAVITDADFLFNQANADGGALWGEWGAVNISDSTFTSNTAGGRGGVAYFASNDPAAASQIHSSVRSSHMTGNSAGQAGGAIFFDLVDVSVGAQETYERGNDFSTNTVATGGYGNDVASPLATLAWENPPKDTVYSGEPLGTVPTGGSSPVVTILVRDLFGQPATQGGTLLSISLEQHATDAVILGATLTTVLGGRVSYSGLLFLTETPGVYTVTVGTATTSTIVPLRVNVTATACPADYALTDRQLQFRVCQAPECAAGTFGTPGACYPCPAGTANAFVGQVSCSACPPGQFSDAGALACSTCPAWASCDAGVPIRRAGWWADETGAAYKCEITAACPGGDVALTTCAPGYEGYLCGKCVSEGDVTYGRQFGACIQCWNRAASIVVVCIYVLVVIGAIGFLIWKASGTAHADASSVMAKIILSYLQMLNIVSNFNTYQDSPLPEISIFTQAATPTSTILPVSCALGYSFYSLLYFTLFIPIVAVGFLAGFWCVLYLIKGSRRPNAREHYFDRFICSVIVIMFIAYPTVTATSLKVFDCRSSSDTGRLRADPEITCYQGGHYVAAVFGALGVVGYGIGIPVWTYHILRKNKDTLETERNRKRYNFLFEGFRGGFAAWSVVVIVRKSLLVALQVFAGTSPSIQVTLGILLVATYAVMHAKTEPYAFPNLNRAEMVGLFTMFVVLVGGVPTVSGFDAKEYGIVVLLIGLAGVAAAVALGMFMLLTRLVVNRRIHHNRVEQVELSSIPEGTLVGAGAFGDAESGPVVTVLTVTATYDRVRGDLDKVPVEYNDLAAPINEAIPPIITVLNYMTDGKAKGVAASALQAILVDARDFARRASGGGGGPLGETSTLSAHPSVVAENGSMGGATGSVVSQGGLMGESTQDPTSGGGDMSALLLTPPPPSARVAGEAGRETAAIRALGERVVARLRTFDADYLAPKRT